MSIPRPAGRIRNWIDRDGHARPAAVAGAGLTVAGIATGGVAGGWLLAAGVALLLAAAYSRRDGLLVLGPFVAREFAIAARRPGFRLVRVTIVLLCLLIVGVVFDQFFTLRWSTLFRPPRARTEDATAAAEVVFVLIALVVYVLSVVAAGFTLPPVVAEERETGRLDHLLVTDLRNRETLLGKSAGRLVVLVGYAALLLPVLFLLTLVGGVDPLYVLALIGLTAGTLAGQTGIAFACTAARPRVGSALAATWLCLGGYLILTGTAYGAGAALAARWGVTSASDALVFVGRGNPFVAMYFLVAAWSGSSLGSAVEPVLRDFVAVNGAVLAAGWWYGVRRVRTELRRHSAPGRRPAGQGRSLSGRPAVADRPVLWYECLLARKRPAVVRWLVLVGVTGWVLATGRDETRRAAVAVIVELIGPFALLMVTVPTAVRAARTVARERERDTLDALRLTDLGPGDITRQKWWGAVRPAAPAAVFLGTMYLLACGIAAGMAPYPTGALPGLGYTAVGLAATTAANVVLAASLGQFVSVASRNQAEAVKGVILGGCVWGLLVLVYVVYRSVDLRGDGYGYAPLALFPPGAQALSGRFLSNTDRTPREWEQLVSAYAESVAVAVGLGLGARAAAAWLFRRRFTPLPEEPNGRDDG